jgi:hypothetical protein
MQTPMTQTLTAITTRPGHPKVTRRAVFGHFRATLATCRAVAGDQGDTQ